LTENIKAILFDKDGVLIDSFDSCFTSFNETLAQYGKQKIPRDRYLKNYWGNKSENNLNKLFKKETLDKKEEILDYYMSRRKYNVYLTKIFNNTISVIEKLVKIYKLGVVTNTSKDLTLNILNKFELLEYFDVIVGGDEGTPKPAPDLILKACEELDVREEQTVFVGDTEADVKAGKAANIITLIIANKSNMELPDKYNDITFIKDIKDVLDFTK
jgi:HAD superfamily hydrolase (TIGR01509 family)